MKFSRCWYSKLSILSFVLTNGDFHAISYCIDKFIFVFYHIVWLISLSFANSAVNIWSLPKIFMIWGKLGKYFLLIDPLNMQFNSFFWLAVHVILFLKLSGSWESSEDFSSSDEDSSSFFIQGWCTARWSTFTSFVHQLRRCCNRENHFPWGWMSCGGT